MERAYKLIVIKLIKKFINTGSKKKDLVAVVGPCISQKNYEVKNNFRKKFLKQNPKNRLHFKIKNNKIYFSLSKYIKKQILDMGISKIDVINKDTFDKRNQYFSSRRSLAEKSNAYGRNISIIMINSSSSKMKLLTGNRNQKPQYKNIQVFKETS